MAMPTVKHLSLSSIPAVMLAVMPSAVMADQLHLSMPGAAPPPHGFVLHPLPPKDLPLESMSAADLKALHLPTDLAQRPKLLRALRAPNAHSVSKIIGTMPHLRMGLQMRGQANIPRGVKADNFESSNWSGSFWFIDPYSVGAPSVGDTVPYPYSVSGGDDWLSVWSGMGGINDLPLWQAGYVEDTNGIGLGGDGSGPVAVTFAECLPDPPIGLFYTGPGHYVFSEVWTDFGGNGWVYAIDYSTGDSVFGSTPCNITGPQTVEWVVEAPSLNGQVVTLAWYGSITLNSATTGNGSTTYNGGDPNANWLTMIQNGTVASQCYPNDETDLTCQAYP